LIKQTLTWRIEMLRDQQVEFLTVIAVYLIYYIFIFGLMSIVQNLTGYYLYAVYASGVFAIVAAYWDWRTK
jgi:lipopolysaccharide export LptBFGC system permease protein LptF